MILTQFQNFINLAIVLSFSKPENFFFRYSQKNQLSKMDIFRRTAHEMLKVTKISKCQMSSIKKTKFLYVQWILTNWDASAFPQSGTLSLTFAVLFSAKVNTATNWLISAEGLRMTGPDELSGLSPSNSC